MNKLFILLIAALGLSASLAPTAAQAACTRPEAIAHRGGSEVYTEGTRKAWKDSMAHGIKIIETDVRFTKDNVPVIMHDATIDRTTNGTGTVAGMTLAQLRNYRTPDGQYVPTLWEYLTDVKAGGGKFLVEHKTIPTGPQWAIFNKRFDDLAIPRSSVVVDSFDKSFLTTVKKYGYTTAWVDSSTTDTASSLITPSTKILFKNYKGVTQARYDTWHKAGITVYPWTIDTSTQWSTLKYADGIVTNKPRGFVEWRGTTCAS